MAINYPKFDQKINDQINNFKMQQPKTRMATVASYNKITHQVTLILDSHYSDAIGNIISGVPCPMVYRVTKCCTRSRR
jgi:hypothetical protein